VPTVSIEIDGTLCGLQENLYRLLLTDNPKLLATKAPNESLLDLAERDPEVFDLALRLAEREVFFYQHLPAIVPRDELELLDAAMDGEMICFLIAARPVLAGPGPATQRDPRVATRDWVLNQRLRHFIGVAGQLSGRSRARRLRDWRVDAHLTAIPSEVATLRAMGIPAYLLDRPWNRNAESLWRIPSLSDFIDLVLNDQREIRRELAAA
jgi:hypothetical protein